jgi:hypothetical protein
MQEGLPVGRHGQLAAFDPLLISEQIDDDAPVGRSSPYLALLPIAALDFTFHRLHGIPGDEVGQRQQDIARRRHDKGSLCVQIDVSRRRGLAV